MRPTAIGKKFGRYFLAGVILSFVFPVIGGWFALYLPYWSTLQSLGFGLLLGLIGVGFGLLSRSSDYQGLNIPLWIFAYGYLLGWVVVRSAVSSESLIVQIGGVLMLLVFVGTVAFVLERLLSSSMLTFPVIIGSAVILLAVQWGVLSILPMDYLQKRIHEHPQQIRPGAVSWSRSVQSVLYPFSVPLDEAVNRLSFLTPSYDPEDLMVFIVFDALRDDYTGARLGNSIDLTPNAERLEEDGIRYPDAFVQAPWTKASTASLFTGKYVHEHGTCMTGNRRAQGLPQEYLTLAERLRRANFTNWGSVFVPHLNTLFQYGQGFDRWLARDSGFRDDLVSYKYFLFEMLRSRPERLFVYLHARGPHEPYGKSLVNTSFWKETEYYKDGALRLEPWNLMHPSDLQRNALKEWKRDHKGELTLSDINIVTHLYASQLHLYDRELLGRFIEGLKGLNVYQDAMITFTSDHGQELFDNYEEGGARYGHFHNLDPTVTRVPLIMKPPTGETDQFLNPDRHSRLIVESIDVGRTLLEYARAPVGEYGGESLIQSRRNGEEKAHLNYALSEVCGLKNPSLPEDTRGNSDSPVDYYGDEKFRKDLFVLKRSFFRGGEGFVLDEKNGNLEIYSRQNGKFQLDFKGEGFDDIPESLREAYQQRFRSVETFQPPIGPLIDMDEATRKALDGLGYIN